jgi:hypothetical protein
VATRVVLLGASNLTTGLPTAIAIGGARLGSGAMDVLVAAGHGRSYGRWSRLFVRGLPAILDCGLWPALAAAGRPTHALLTDVGNDIAYGVEPAELAGWVDTCLARLAGARAIVTLLPVARLTRLAPWQYHLFKTVIFPGRRLPFRLFHARLAEVNARLGDLAVRHRATVVEPPADWYGADPIHVPRGRQAAAWDAVLAAWGTGLAGAPRVERRGLAPAWRTLCGVSLRRPQPSAVLPDGTSISLY